MPRFPARAWRLPLAVALLALTAAPLTAQPAPDDGFLLVNNTGRPVERVFVNPSRLHEWGYNRLGAAMLPSGARHLIRLVPGTGCRQDIRVVYADGAMQDLRHVDICHTREVVLGGPPPEAPPPPRAARPAPELWLRNHAGRPIVIAYVSPSGRPDWGPDRLQEHPVPPGAERRIALAPAECRYDVKVVYLGGAMEEKRGLDLCARPMVGFP